MGKTLELIAALLEGKQLEKNHGEKGSWWHETRQHVSVLSSYVYNEKRYFEIQGWGSAFGKAEDRIIELLTEPDKWSVMPNSDKNAQECDASKDDK